MNRALPIVAILTILTFSKFALSATPANGKALYTSCGACHGTKGEGNPALGAPNIAGMDAWYLKVQLENYASGKRGTKPGDTYGAQMRAGSSAVNTDANRASIVAYVSKMPKVSMPAKPASKANLANGSTQYNALCSACHAANGKGNQSLGAPSLVGTNSAYLIRQFKAYRTGLRGYDAKDKYGKQMAAMSKMLPAKAEPDVFAYINTLKP